MLQIDLRRTVIRRKNHENDVSAAQKAAQTCSRLSCTYGNGGRQKGSCGQKAEGQKTPVRMKPAAGLTACRKRTRICKAYSRLSSIKQNTEIRAVYRKGKKYTNRDLILYVLRNHPDQIRLTVSVSGKNGNSVVRHRFQRLVKEVFRLYAPQLDTGMDIVIRAQIKTRYSRPDELSFDKMHESITALLKRAGLLHKSGIII